MTPDATAGLLLIGSFVAATGWLIIHCIASGRREDRDGHAEVEARIAAHLAPTPVVPAWPETDAEHPLELTEHVDAMFTMLTGPSLRVVPGRGQG